MEERLREFPFTRRDFDYMRRIANQRTGIVVSDEKFDMFYSRLSRRVRKLGLKSFEEYCELIKNEKDDNEVLELVNAITTNLTAFFRENHHFEYLTSTAFPEMLAKNQSTRRLRVWSAGCSTGEEPYSLSICMRESIPNLAGWNASILATDIDSNVLARAAEGVYPVERVNGIDKSRLRRWFLRGKGQHSDMVKLKKDVQSLIQFGQLNLMDPWSVGDPMDIIFCRNVIIYFDKDSKTRLIDRYADALCDGGYLFIGHSESLYKITERFELVGNTIYRKKW